MRQLFIVLFTFTVAVFLASCSSTKTEEIPTAEERFHLGMAEFEDANYFEAIQQFEIIRLQFPGSSVSDSARFFMGMSRFKREEFLLASYEFSQMIQNSPSSSLAPEAQYMFAECYFQLSPKAALDQSYTSKAIDALQSFIEYYPTNQHVEDAEKQILELVNKLAEKEYNTGVLYTKLENYPSALIYFNTVIDRYYNTDFVDDAMAWKIRIHMQQKKYDDASPVIDTFLGKYPDSPFFDEVHAFKKQLGSVMMGSTSLQ